MHLHVALSLLHLLLLPDSCSHKKKTHTFLCCMSILNKSVVKSQNLWHNIQLVFFNLHQGLIWDNSPVQISCDAATCWQQKQPPDSITTNLLNVCRGKAGTVTQFPACKSQESHIYSQHTVFFPNTIAQSFTLTWCHMKKINKEINGNRNA